MKCPICNSNKTNRLLNLNCNNFDESVIYKDIRINVCNSCGHIYNELTIGEIYWLGRYYIEEYAPLNLDSVDKCGMRPGSNSLFSLTRYAEMYDLLSTYINKDSRILDVGCALGGFLKFLKDKGIKNVYGIDVIEEYVELADDKNITIGSVYDLPFEDNSFDVIILEQVMEHLADLKTPIGEIRRVLTDDGVLFVGVPNASKYDNLIFWLTIKEHIQHFDIDHLALLYRNNGFQLESYRTTEMPMTSEKTPIPVILALFKKKEKDLELHFKHLASQLKRKDVFNELVKTERPIYCYGIGREFLFFYMSTALKDYDKLYLVDDTPSKQSSFTIDGKIVVGSHILKEATDDSILIVIPSLHRKVMTDKALELGYGGEIINV
jgi:2-polyprenyl-3-methyl-5-hydroxy-6-metoxy-1,4-benzoquinol methylase